MINKLPPLHHVVGVQLTGGVHVRHHVDTDQSGGTVSYDMKKIEATDHLAEGRLSPVTDRVFPFQTPSLYSGRRSLWKAVLEAERLNLLLLVLKDILSSFVYETPLLFNGFYYLDKNMSNLGASPIATAQFSTYLPIKDCQYYYRIRHQLARGCSPHMVHLRTYLVIVSTQYSQLNNNHLAIIG